MKQYLKIVRHYENCLKTHGDTHLGVDWPKLEDVEKRYFMMLDIISFNNKEFNDVTVLDFGCGAAHLYEFILKHKMENIVYTGLDISDKFIKLCKKKHPNIQFICEDVLEKKSNFKKYDYIIMNGVFTEKLDLSFDEMWEYFQKLITVNYNLINKGISFNVMSKNVSYEREDLFHLSLDLLTRFLTEKITSNYIIRNDYGLYEYTVYLYR